MSKRQDFRFQFAVAALLEASARKAAYHRDHVADWTERRDKAEAALRETGVEIREHAVTGGKQFSLVADPEKLDYYNKCDAKLREHIEKAEAFERWQHAFELHPDGWASFDLDVDDVAYFGL